jgi:hypothetical protein
MCETKPVEVDREFPKPRLTEKAIVKHFSDVQRAKAEAFFVDPPETTVH